MRGFLPPVLFMLLWLGAPPRTPREANTAYEAGDYAAAEAAYRGLLDADPDDARLWYNLGNALARQGKTQEAVQAYEQFKARTADPDDRARADYNIGHTYGTAGQWDRAERAFREALRQDPDDAQTRYNYELARRNRQEPPPQQGGGQQDPQNGDKQDQQGDQQQEQQGEGQDQGDRRNPEQQRPENQPGEESGPENRMSRAEAENLLNALQNKERDLLSQFQKNQLPPRTRHAKDW